MFSLREMFTQIATIGILCLHTCKFIKIQWEKYDLKNVERADRFDEKNLSLHFFNGVGCLCIKKLAHVLGEHHVV